MASPGSKGNPSEAEEKFKQKLLEIGLLSQINVPKLKQMGDRTPVRIKGKNLSVTIIEERR